MNPVRSPRPRGARRAWALLFILALGLEIVVDGYVIVQGSSDERALALGVIGAIAFGIYYTMRWLFGDDSVLLSLATTVLFSLAGILVSTAVGATVILLGTGVTLLAIDVLLKRRAALATASGSMGR
ncbi:hypothetical protein OCAE111667_22845 [Occultella aeris]|uniref:Uncharacterized protein n=1 Tax=Occultella aeris TaxID=2761496 RepID=A0A7M4DSI9_9MICO|nr:hypothetical protein [Occultella aeris]VZO40433.1 hypothetical protein HALOF300_05137 [Occultella aeris]